MWPASKSTKLNCVYDILLEYEDADAVYAFVDFECIFARMRMRVRIIFLPLFAKEKSNMSGVWLKRSASSR